MRKKDRIFRLVMTFFVLSVSLTSCHTPTYATEDSFSAGQRDSGVTRFLVMGRDAAAGLTDSIFVVTLNDATRQATVLQLPRDTYAEYTTRDYKKLNAALNTLGASETKRFLSRALGVRLDYFVTLDLSCVRRLVDAVGGVDVVLPQEMHYSDPEQGLEINLPQGAVHLDGKGAEQLVRFRSGYVNADLGRLDAQKLFLQAFAKSCKKLSVGSLLKITGVVLTRVQTDIDLPTAIQIATKLQTYDTDCIPMATLSGSAIRGNSGAWYYVLNKKGASLMINEYCLPQKILTETEFDPDGIFDREDHPDFHKLYTAEPTTDGG
ncbi:MAG: LytR family transcriptional regulator [Ruminococcaceae bacterium]|nr:LytR family transcriptional regulator [Oscillospiraceae bacterium]